jgi:hypothetical protein
MSPITPPLQDGDRPLVTHHIFKRLIDGTPLDDIFPLLLLSDCQYVTLTRWPGNRKMPAAMSLALFLRSRRYVNLTQNHHF